MTNSSSPQKMPKRRTRSRESQLKALKSESNRELEDLIRRRLALPMEKRTNFLRVRLPLPGGGSCL